MGAAPLGPVRDDGEEVGLAPPRGGTARGSAGRSRLSGVTRTPSISHVTTVDPFAKTLVLARERERVELRVARDVALGRDQERVVARERRRRAGGVARLGEAGDEVQPEPARHAAQPLLASARPAAGRSSRRPSRSPSRTSPGGSRGDAPSSAARFRSFGRAGVVRRPVLPGEVHLEEGDAHRRDYGSRGRDARASLYGLMGGDALPEGLGPPHGAEAPDGADAALRGPAPRPRGDEPAGLRHDPRATAGRVAFPARTVATVDHIVPTDEPRPGPSRDAMAEEMLVALERNCREFGIPFFDLGAPGQGIVHVIGPELGLTQPGMTIACGDSHTSTHGAFGALAFGIGTSQVRDVLASQCLAMEPLKAPPDRGRRATSRPASTPRTSSSRSSGRLGVKGGVGFAYEYGGAAIDAHVDGRADDALQHVDRGRGARRLREPRRDDLRLPEGPPVRPERRRRGTARSRGGRRSPPTPDARVRRPRDAGRLGPRADGDVGDQPGAGARRSRGASRRPRTTSPEARVRSPRRSTTWGFKGGEPIAGTQIDVAFIGSCTNGRLSDLREAARVVKGRRVAKGVKALVVPGSNAVRLAAEEGRVSTRSSARPASSGASAGCSMCLAMNPDRLEGRAGLRLVLEPELQGAAGEPDGPDAPDEPGDGRGRGDRGRGRRTCGRSSEGAR